MPVITFKSIFSGLQSFWAEHGCIVIPAYPAEVGAGTFHPSTIFNCCSNRMPNLKIAYTQPCVRPVDNRGGTSKNRLYQHHQFQVLMKPVPDNMQELYLDSLRSMGVSLEENDIRFIEDNWENPSIGAYGLGWEVQMNGMEVTQFTYMQRVGSLDCPVTPVELAYGMERVAMLIQGCDSVFDIVWDDSGITYGDFFLEHERQFALSLAKGNNSEVIYRELMAAEVAAVHFTNMKLPMVAYKHCLTASHLLNLLDAGGTISYNIRADFILRIKGLIREICELWNRGS